MKNTFLLLLLCMLFSYAQSQDQFETFNHKHKESNVHKMFPFQDGFITIETYSDSIVINKLNGNGSLETLGAYGLIPEGGEEYYFEDENSFNLFLVYYTVVEPEFNSVYSAPILHIKYDGSGAESNYISDTEGTSRPGFMLDSTFVT